MREYGIDLAQDEPQLSWRRFCVLLNGLSHRSRWVLHQIHEPHRIENPKAAERAVFAAMG